MLDIDVHDTYFIISKTDLTIVISTLFAIIGVGYWIMLKANRNLSKWLNLIHITLTFGGILLIWIFAQLFRESVMESNFNEILTFAIYLTTLIAVLGQIFFLVNIINGLMKKKNVNQND